MKRKWSTGLLVALVFLGMSSADAPVAAQKAMTLDEFGCGTLGGAWDRDLFTCSVRNFATISVDLTIPEGITLYIANEGSISNDGTIRNSGTVSNDGAIVNAGLITNNDSGLVNNNDSGFIANDGTITNDGGSFFNDSGLIVNDGILTNDGGLFVNDNGTIINYGTITNNGGILSNESWTVNDGGIITNNDDGTIINGGAIVNKNGAAIVRFGWRQQNHQSLRGLCKTQDAFIEQMNAHRGRCTQSSR